MLIESLDEKRCRVCGKNVVALYPNRWAYKKRSGSGFIWYCSWGCMRKDEKEEEKDMSITENGMEAVRIAIEGGDYLGFLRESGSKAPDKLWYYIKNKLKTADPVKYAELEEELEKRQEKRKKEKRRMKSPAKAEPPIPKKVQEKITEAWQLTGAAPAPDPVVGIKIEAPGLKMEEVRESDKKQTTFFVQHWDTKDLMEMLDVVAFECMKLPDMISSKEGTMFHNASVAAYNGGVMMLRDMLKKRLAPAEDE